MTPEKFAELKQQGYSHVPLVKEVLADLDTPLSTYLKLANGPYSSRLKARVGGPLGHLSNTQAAGLLAEIDSSRLQHVVAAHLSEQNNQPDLAREALAGALDCTADWIGVAGQVFGTDGEPKTNLVVVVRGWFGGVKNEVVAVTGTVAGDIYGPGGYEAVIGDAPQATQKQLSIQVFDLDGHPLTAITRFDTYDACDKNLIIINFSQ